MAFKITAHKKEDHPESASPAIDVERAPKRHRIALYAAVAVAIVTSLFAVSQFQNVSALKAHNAQLQSNYDTVLAQKSAVLKNASSLQEENISLRQEVLELNERRSELQAESAERLLSLTWYENNVALINNFHGNCAYHTYSCFHLGKTFYVTTVHGAESQGCWPCSDCH